MGKFGDLDQYFDPGLTLTVLGREYTLPLPSAEMGLWCRRMAELTQLPDTATDEQIQAAADKVSSLPPLPGEQTFEERLLGPVYPQMLADAVPDPYVQFCALTAYFWIVLGEDGAARYWTAGGRPESQARTNRASRRAQQRTTTAEVSETPSPASSSGMSSRPKSRRSGRGRGSRGQRS